MKTKQNNYSFTLVLTNVTQHTPGLEDSLYESGCDDALINFRNKTVYLDFDREADSLEDAVMSAIQAVESSSVGAKVASVTPEDLVTESDIAKRLNKNRQLISLWVKGERRTKNPFPNPAMKLTEKSPFWHWHQIAKWLYDNKLLTRKEAVENAHFLMHLNAVLEGRDSNVMQYRQTLLQRLQSLN